MAVTNSVSPSEAQVGESVTFTFTVTNDGDVPLTDVQVDSDLPSGLDLVGTSDGGSIDPDTGYAGWALSDGLGVGASTTLSVTTMTSEPGTWTTDVGAVAQDAPGIEVEDCASATVVSGTDTVAHRDCDTHCYSHDDANSVARRDRYRNTNVASDSHAHFGEFADGASDPDVATNANTAADQHASTDGDAQPILHGTAVRDAVTSK